MLKICPPDKILNIKTNRCVSKTGNIGKQIEKKQDKPKSGMLKICPPDKILNIKTNRCVSKTGNIGKQIEKEQEKPKSGKIEKEHEKPKSGKIEKEQEKPKNKSSSLSSSRSSLKSYEYINSSNKIKRFVDYEIITKYLNDIKLNSTECITPYKKPNKYLLTNNIILYKQIGSKSVYGVIYKCKNINKSYEDIPVFTIKLQLITAELKIEMFILKYLSDHAIKYKIPNLPIIYKMIKCNTIFHKNKDYPKILTNAKIKNKNYSLILNELASGDLHNFLNYKYYNVLTSELWQNTYEQIFISLAILHSLGISHNDAHDGNFLYHKIKPGGCFHYKINNTDYYIKNLGFLWTTWDYGLTGKLYNQCSYISDYMRINLSMRKNDLSEYTDAFKKHMHYSELKQWGYLSDKVNVPSNIRQLKYIIWDKLEKTKAFPDVELMKKKITEDLWLKYFLDNDLLFSKFPIGNILSSSEINFKPYKDNGLYSKNEFNVNKYIS